MHQQFLQSQHSMMIYRLILVIVLLLVERISTLNFLRRFCLNHRLRKCRPNWIFYKTECLILPQQTKNNRIFKSYSYLLAPAKKSSTFCSSLFRNANPLNMIAYFMKPNCEISIGRFRIKRI